MLEQLDIWKSEGDKVNAMHIHKYDGIKVVSQWLDSSPVLRPSLNSDIKILNICFGFVSKHYAEYFSSSHGFKETEGEIDQSQSFRQSIPNERQKFNVLFKFNKFIDVMKQYTWQVWIIMIVLMQAYLGGSVV